MKKHTIVRLTLAVAFLLSAALLAGCTNEPPVNPRKVEPLDPGQTKMPVVTELSLGRAMTRIEESGLELRLIKWTEGSDLRPGTVVSQEPQAGNTVPKGRSVTLVVAGAPGDVEVPDVVGMSLRQARETLAAAALIPTVNANSDRDPATVKVVDQYPAPGSKAPVGTRVEIVTP